MAGGMVVVLVWGDLGRCGKTWGGGGATETLVGKRGSSIQCGRRVWEGMGIGRGWDGGIGVGEREGEERAEIQEKNRLVNREKEEKRRERERDGYFQEFRPRLRECSLVPGPCGVQAVHLLGVGPPLGQQPHNE